MRLTNQMQTEVIIMNDRINDINENILIPLINGHSYNIGGIRGVPGELKTFKVRLENLLCETDVKEQVHTKLNAVNC